MEYRFDPYTGQPLPQTRPANSRTWLGGGSPQPQSAAQSQPPTRQEQPGVIFRQVASLDEAKAVPTDFSGALTIMPDWAHGYIYAKALGDDGNPLFRAYRYDPSASAPVAIPVQTAAYAPLEDLQQLKNEVNALKNELAERVPAKETAEKPAGKGNKS